jgi:hypothetical protein
MPIREIVVTTLGELVDKVTPAQPDPATGRRRYAGVYHGAGDASWSLLTSLDRLGGVRPPHTKADLEEHILRNFIRYSRPYFANPPANEWELLIAAQHHGLPTRLLDWSYSPLVAAHFATLRQRQEDLDRAVWQLDWKQVHRAFGFPELALLFGDLQELFGKGGHFTPWALMAGKDGRTFACMIDPPSLDARIIAQSATFTLCSDKSQSFDRFLEAHDLAAALTKFVIPAREVRLFRDQLDLVGFDERRLFPDLDGVAAEMKRYYS